MSTIRSEFYNNFATVVVDDISYRRANFYYYLGKVDPWETTEPFPEPTTAVTTEADMRIRDNIVYARRVSPNDVTIVTYRHIWEEDMVYAQWDHTQVMVDEAFHVTNSEFSVYKCLDNAGGAPSTIEPTGSDIDPFTTSDGYLWKYMYSIPTFKRRKFLSRQFMPVQRALTDGFFNRGAVEQVVVDSPGSGYVDAGQVVLTVSGDGTGAVLIAVISKNTGEFLDVIIKDGGSGYTTATINITAAAGSGAYGNETAVLTPVVFGGSVVRVLVEDPGTGYPPDVATSIIALGDGIGAAFSPVISGGQVVDVVVDNPGSNYSSISLSVIGAGTGASLTGVIGASDFLSDQSVVEQSAVPGAIYNVVVTERGADYTPQSTVTIEGDGDGATASLVVGEDGGIDRVVITTPGFGYTTTNVIITDPNRDLPVGYDNASAYAILPPIGGHGSNAVKELFGDTVVVFSLLQSEEQLNLLAQDYRQYGLIINPTSILANKQITAPTNVVTFRVAFDNVADIELDDLIICNRIRYRVIYIDGLEVTLSQLKETFTEIVVGDAFTNPNYPLNEHSVQTVLTKPLLNKYSGNLIYRTNSAPLVPSQEQLIAVRTYIKLGACTP